VAGVDPLALDAVGRVEHELERDLEGVVDLVRSSVSSKSGRTKATAA